MKKTLLIALLFSAISFAQNYEHITDNYPDWRTDFTKTSIDYEELMSGGPPKDGIPAIRKPEFISVDEAAAWLGFTEPVIAVEINGTAKAYPLQILLWHEIVNDKISGIPALITFCPLCNSSIVFDRRINSIEYSFGVSGLLRNSDLVMYDHQTESFWQQFTGEAIVGKMLNSKLKFIPSQIISFKSFFEIYPDGVVLSKETGYKRPYGLNPYPGYDSKEGKPFMYKGEIKDIIAPLAKVVGVRAGNSSMAYPLDLLKKQGVINTTVGELDAAILFLPDPVSALDEKLIRISKRDGSAVVFDRNLDGKILNFKIKDGKLLDGNTGSIWDISGRAIQGKLKGGKLSKIQYGIYFSFAWFAFEPESALFGGGNSEE